MKLNRLKWEDSGFMVESGWRVGYIAQLVKIGFTIDQIVGFDVYPHHDIGMCSIHPFYYVAGDK